MAMPLFQNVYIKWDRYKTTSRTLLHNDIITLQMDSTWPWSLYCALIARSIPHMGHSMPNQPLGSSTLFDFVKIHTEGSSIQGIEMCKILLPNSNIFIFFSRVKHTTPNSPNWHFQRCHVWRVISQRLLHIGPWKYPNSFSYTWTIRGWSLFILSIRYW